jgi:lysophospholipase L1-like esterase
MSTPPIFPRGHRILFIGDSITDGDRSRTGDVNHDLGDTFVRIIAARYGADHPRDGIAFINRGINGHRVTDLEERWETDCLALQPDLLTILVGVNDAASVVELTVPPPPRTDGRPPKSLVTREMFRETYDRILTLTLKRLPSIRIILCTPFVLPVGKIGRDWALWNEEVLLRTSMIRDLAGKHGADLLEFQPLFDRASQLAPPSFWIPDGVHPSAAGHQLMADAWIDKVSSGSCGN